MPSSATLARPIGLTFRALSDLTRLRILHLLQGGEMCVGDLASALRVEQPSASRHLAYLRRAGLVAVRRAKTWCYYSLAPATSPFHEKLLECLREAAAGPEARADAARAARLARSGGCCPEP